MPVTNDTYVTVQPDGSVLFNFTGHISAKGLDLPEGLSSTPSNDSRVRWLRQSDGAMVGQLLTYEDNFFQQTYMQMTNPGLGSASLAAAWDKANAIAEATATVFKTGASSAIDRIIINSLGQSQFLQLSGLANLHINVGASSLGSFNGAGSRSQCQATFAHGLSDGLVGRTPIIVLATGSGTVGITEDGGGNPHEYWVSCVGKDATNITLRAEVNGTTNNGASCYWLAIG